MDLMAFYEGIDLQAIDEYVDVEQEESHCLEFKTVKDCTLSDKNDRRNFARSLSGFANGQGGIVIWGISAKRKGDSRHAVGKERIDDVRQFVQRLNEMACQYASPALSGVRNEAITVGDGTGFAKTFVPETDSNPVMAKAGENRYYKRSGDSFMPMEAYEIADMFGRRKRPILSLEVQARSVWDIQRNHLSKPFIVVSIKNSGRGVAKRPFLEVTLNDDYTDHIKGVHRDGEGLFRFDSRKDEEGEVWHPFGSSSEIVIYPGLPHEVFWVGGFQAKSRRFVVPMIINYRLVAEEVPLQEGRLHISQVLLGTGLHRATTAGSYHFATEHITEED